MNKDSIHKSLYIFTYQFCFLFYKRKSIIRVKIYRQDELGYVKNMDKEIVDYYIFIKYYDLSQN